MQQWLHELFFDAVATFFSFEDTIFRRFEEKHWAKHGPWKFFQRRPTIEHFKDQVEYGAKYSPEDERYFDIPFLIGKEMAENTWSKVTRHWSEVCSFGQAVVETHDKSGAKLFKQELCAGLSLVCRFQKPQDQWVISIALDQHLQHVSQ